MTKQVVGIDVGKEKLDVGLNSEKRVRVWANDEKGRAALLIRTYETKRSGPNGLGE